MGKEPVASMNESTQQFVIRMIAIVLSVAFLGIVGLFGFSVMTGDTVIPEQFQVQFWNIATTVIVVAGGSLVIFFNNRNAMLARLHSDQNHHETQAAVQEVEHKVTNGLAQKTADIVKTESKLTAAELAIQTAHQAGLIEANTLAITQLSNALIASTNAQASKLDLLLLAAPGLSGGVPVDVQAVDAHTAAVEEDTAAIQAHTDEISS